LTTSFIGHVRNGVVALKGAVSLADGQSVRVELPGGGTGDRNKADGGDRVRQLQLLFADWTEEEGKLADEEVDRFRVALDRNQNKQSQDARPLPRGCQGKKELVRAMYWA
jgi:hypothetical protein